MAYEIGFVDNAGSEGLAHWQMLLKIKTLAEANGWTTLRYLNPTDGTNRELIMKGVGLSGTEEIYIGFRTYHSSTADYYNMTVAGFYGYVDANSFTTQPGWAERGVCAHNQRIDYWLSVNAQRIFFGMKIGSPSVYETAYVGKFFPYATPGQYPYPLAMAGTLPSATPATRYSDASAGHTAGVKGNTNGYLLNPVRGWSLFRTSTWTPGTGSGYYDLASIRRDSGGYYEVLKTVLMTGSDVLGDLDGIYYVSGFNNLSENTMVIDGVTYVVLGDIFRTGFGDYMLLRMS